MGTEDHLIIWLWILIYSLQARIYCMCDMNSEAFLKSIQEVHKYFCLVLQPKTMSSWCLTLLVLLLVPFLKLGLSHVPFIWTGNTTQKLPFVEITQLDENAPFLGDPSWSGLFGSSGWISFINDCFFCSVRCPWRSQISFSQMWIMSGPAEVQLWLKCLPLWCMLVPLLGNCSGRLFDL